MVVDMQPLTIMRNNLNPPTVTTEFFNPQTDQVNLDVDRDLLIALEVLARNANKDNLTISSGKRTVAATDEIREKRIKREGLDKLPEKDLEDLRFALDRGHNPDMIVFPSGKSNLIFKQFPNLEPHRKAIMKIRKDFGGLQSSHINGKKVDIPYSFFKNNEEAIEFSNVLENAGLKVLREPKAGIRGVMDISLPKDGKVDIPPAALRKLTSIEKQMNAENRKRDLLGLGL